MTRGSMAVTAGGGLGVLSRSLVVSMQMTGVAIRPSFTCSVQPKC